ncbi:acetyl-CoA carboxylase biotin carboxyl carrier protein [Taibaiella lutea]|uniref:Biotin carboxyl carrier protein of acetyl-CoA carboxylase n=1 Tax=Taibaiella lutea TaxID=2608001 RepID=A0A5M6CAJ3_9BACT|nr:acetyl-CoA carboxylase biotin carboxyl carrier protein [Taibaiella lutea]KAA5532197.1 acetyl-CoA carboxylase biotin carboxyl carrier protein [Taibaiella lutea]
MEYKQIQELLKAVNKSNISELSIKDGDFEITIKQANTETQFVAVQASMPQMMQQAPQQMMHAPQAPQQIAAAPAAPSAPAAEASNTVTIKSPMIGTFYRSSGPDKPAFVAVGDEIKTGQVICIVEAMKLFNEIESEISGRIVKVLVDDASPIEYDQPLFLVEPA